MATATAEKIAAKPVKIALNLIKADKSLQPRVEMDREHQERMARAYVEGEDVPPPVHVFWDGKFYWLGDGFHRYHAMWSLRHMGAKFTQIKCIVHNGTKREAVVYAAHANLDNRSKPMTNEDRKKAMWMLLEDEEWRGKAPATIGKTLQLSANTAKRYWVEYFHANGMEVPTTAEDSKGRVRPTRQRSRGSRDLPKLAHNSRGGYFVRLEGKKLLLGKDIEEANHKLIESVGSIELIRRKYEESGRISSLFMAAHLSARAVFVAPNSYPGARGMETSGIAVVWESFRVKSDAVAAIGRAVCCREMIGATRTVVLCPVEDGPPEVMELGRKAGIEFMTIEDFVASLKGDDHTEDGGDAS